MEKLANALDLLVISVLYLLLPLSPVGCTILSSDGRYLLGYSDTITRCAVMLGAMRKTGVLRRNFLKWLNRKAINLSPTDVIYGDCTHCGRCCIDGTCVFVEFVSGERSKCLIYKNWFWRRTSCGQYPMTSSDIAVYNCPSFKAIPIKLVLGIR
jgi:hypothetical protein